MKIDSKFKYGIFRIRRMKPTVCKGKKCLFETFEQAKRFYIDNNMPLSWGICPSLNGESIHEIVDGKKGKDVY